jgi:hypothetical protein
MMWMGYPRSATEDQLAKIEVREGDELTVKLRVVRVSDDGETFTLQVGGQRFTTTGVTLDIVGHQKGGNWPS